MKTFVPDYYNDFRCLAGDCKHSCCIGWEIDIDEDTLNYYNSVKGEFGKRLKKSISLDETPHFCMSESERCPFLNEAGLCDIMLELGFDKVSQICDDHPRFRNFYSDRTETGLGMSCEAVAQMIVSKQDKTKLVCIEDGEECLWPEEWEFIDLRDKVFSELQNREKTIEERTEGMLALCDAKPLEGDIFYWADVFGRLERLDERWTVMLEEMKNRKAEKLPEYQWISIAFEQIMVYFSFRHLADSLDDDMLARRRRFVALSTMIIYNLCRCSFKKTGIFTSEDMAEICRMYSSEIEYSPDNMNALLDLLKE